MNENDFKMHFPAGPKSGIRPSMRLSLLLIIPLFLAACKARDVPAPLEAVQPQCTSAPCGNTASGKDPQAEAIEKGQRMLNAQRTSNDDQERWSVPLFSDSTLEDELTVEVLRSPRMTMRLFPPEGHLSLTTPSSKHMFNIAEPEGSDSICPKYSLRILEASEMHVVLEKRCRRFEYKPDRYAMTVAYYLYDQPSGAMREIWVASASGKDDPAPVADPRPTLERIANGYRFDWSGVYPGSASGERYELHNRFTRKRYGKELILECTNLVSGATSEPEDESACEGAYLERVGG